MGDDPTEGIRELLRAQNQQPSPKILHLPAVLPPIGGRAHSSAPLPLGPPSIRLNSSDPLLGTELRSLSRFSLTSRASRRSRELTPEPIRPILPAGKGISRMPFQIVQLPTLLPAIPGLSFAIDNLTNHRLDSILNACRLYDSEERGYLSQPSVLKCIGEVVPSAHAADSPWREFLEEIAPHGEFIDYRQFVELIRAHHQGGTIPIDTNPSIPEVLGTMRGRVLMEELPSRPTSSQASRERGRLEVMLEIETILIRYPELDIEQLKMITHQKVMEQSELLTLLELYGLLDHFKSFQNRLLDSFLTHDNKFHYSAFVGCLQTIRTAPKPQSPIDLGKTYRFGLTLPPLGQTAIPRPGVSIEK